MKDISEITFKSEISIEENGVTIGCNYFIAANRIKTREALLAWLHHLSEKAWFTTQHAHDLIEKVYISNGWNLYPNDFH